MVTPMLEPIGNNMLRNILAQMVSFLFQIGKSCFRHRRLDLMLIVYVDDFKLAGP